MTVGYILTLSPNQQSTRAQNSMIMAYALRSHVMHGMDESENSKTQRRR
jgi:hypothetical protein